MKGASDERNRLAVWATLWQVALVALCFLAAFTGPAAGSEPPAANSLALGSVAGGAGVLGLQRAFQLSGAKATVASLWKIPDRATSQLMQRFYENLWDKKLSKIDALRDAQLWMLKEGASVDWSEEAPFTANFQPASSALLGRVHAFRRLAVSCDLFSFTLRGSTS